MSGDGSTPTPWGLSIPLKFVVARTGLGSIVIADIVTTDGRPSAEAEANARRIVAAVNATADIPVEALEAGVVAKLAEAAKSYMQAVFALGEQPAGRTDTYFEAPLLDTPDAVTRWVALNDAGKRLSEALALAKGEAA